MNRKQRVRQRKGNLLIRFVLNIIARVIQLTSSLLALTVIVLIWQYRGAFGQIIPGYNIPDLWLLLVVAVVVVWFVHLGIAQALLWMAHTTGQLDVIVAAQISTARHTRKSENNSQTVAPQPSSPFAPPN